MQIKDMEELVGITKKNIRFYEKEGLIEPDRSENGYRVYTEDHVQILKEIKLLRKLGIPLEDIRMMQQGKVTLESEMKLFKKYIDNQMAELNHAKIICSKLEKENRELSEINVDGYLETIQNMENRGMKFRNIIKDYIYYWKREYQLRKKIVFEPNDPIIDKWDFANELYRYAEREDKEITIYRESMAPEIKFDKRKYICMLTPPTMFLPGTFLGYFLGAFARTYGFKWVTMFPID